MLPPSRRPIKSFVRREGRFTPGQRTALTTLWEHYVLTADKGILDWNKVFGRTAATVLDIGFGMGHSLLAMAAAHPEKNFVGIEVYRPGIGTVLTQLHQQKLTNVRVLYGDAQVLTPQCLSNESVAAVHLFFPDPWPKTRHHKRRIVQTAFIELLATKIEPNGYLHLATDWENYAHHMMQVLSGISHLQNSMESDQFSMNPGERPATKYEQRGKNLGHQVWDLKFYKRNHL